MPDPASLLAQLMSREARPGRVAWIGLRPQRRAEMNVVDRAEAVAERGLEGDRYSKKGGKRQVTLVQAEHLAAIASYLGKEVPPEQIRRNIVVEGLNLLGLKGKRFRVGDALLEHTGPCAPCSRMEEYFGHGAYNAMRGHGGITAKVIEGGTLRVGDSVSMMRDGTEGGTGDGTMDGTGDGTGDGDPADASQSARREAPDAE